MDPQNNPNMSMAGGMTTPQENTSSVGPVIAAIVILAVIIFGALYFMSQKQGDEASQQDEVNAITSQSDSDEASAIEADLNATNIDNLDTELNAQ